MSVEEVWRGLGLPGIVDVHTHFMPQRVLDKVQAYFAGAEAYLGFPWPIAHGNDPDDHVKRLREFGVVAFTSMIYAHKPGMAAWLNAWAREFAAATPGCALTATFFPEESAADYVREALESGARVFKAHLQVGEYDPRDPLLDDVWGMIADAGAPVVTHCGSGPVPGRFTGPGPITGVLERHPRLRVVVAHMGLPEYGAFLDLAGRFPGVGLDTTMAFTEFTEQAWPFPPSDRSRLLDYEDRILFGSDFPNIPYAYAEAVGALVRLDLGDDWLRAVLYGNGVQILRPMAP
ncbi:amidohydrolase [Herbidospora galbida]|uniref:Amidohydrolase n=1 Tax=Herbidospora galbida TaxID=2575442 RepID=A0A4U3MDB8_9ACTN|nr:amidohydrolase family protein [Herbidospora galbida]TKK86392.1 amidohydrolase [Herbidospora galbida]